MYTLICFQASSNTLTLTEKVNPEYLPWCFNDLNIAGNLYTVAVKGEEVPAYVSQIIDLEKKKAEKVYEDSLSKLDNVKVIKL